LVTANELIDSGRPNESELIILYLSITYRVNALRTQQMVIDRDIGK
jgi:hypothetical protein